MGDPLLVPPSPQHPARRDPRWIAWLGEQSWLVVGTICLSGIAAVLLVEVLARPGLAHIVLRALAMGLAILPIAAKVRHDTAASDEALKLRHDAASEEALKRRQGLRRVGQVLLVVISCALIGGMIGVLVGSSTGNRAVWVPVVVVFLGIFFLGLIALAIIAILVRRTS